MLPWARFLIRRGMAVLGYDKRGVGESTGDCNTASKSLQGFVPGYFSTVQDWLASRIPGFKTVR